MSPIDLVKQYNEAKKERQTLLLLPPSSEETSPIQLKLPIFLEAAMEAEKTILPDINVTIVDSEKSPLLYPSETTTVSVWDSSLSLASAAQIYQPQPAFVKPAMKPLSWTQKLGLMFITVGLGGMAAAVYPFLTLEWNYLKFQTPEMASAWVAGLIPKFSTTSQPVSPVPSPSPGLDHNPLVTPEGTLMIPANTYFSIQIPKIGVNAPIIAGVNPVSKQGYSDALKKGVAHASTSFYPNENGTVYLFSHSTNYEWFVKDLNAVFYLLTKLEPGDEVVVMYLGNRYTYRIREKKVVAKREVAYLAPQPGNRVLILQTCWPPGTNAKRMLIFADLVDETIYGKFEDLIIKPQDLRVRS